LFAGDAKLSLVYGGIGDVDARQRNVRDGETPIMELERRFDAAVLDIYKCAKAEADYDAALFLQMYGGIAALRQCASCCAFQRLRGIHGSMGPQSTPISQLRY
jgi:hypothetical protein